ncbi:MAG TPA: hypothetical protein PK098_12430 [Phycisphaerales bacterium]|nr:hypothetical protein [Phycisphaerales bacterium]
MRHGIVRFLAFLILLVQGALGSVAPVAVLCMHHGSCGGSSIVIAVPQTSCCVRGCCESHLPQERAATQLVITIAPPCDADCQSCVDIGLPDLDLAIVDRVGVGADDLNTGLMPLAMASFSVAPMEMRVLPPATGPPERMGCLHAPIIRSTRLLI